MLTVKPPPNNAAWDVYHPPPPPICDTAWTLQADPIRIHSNKHNDEHALMLIVTNAVKPSNNGFIGAIEAAAAARPSHPDPMTTTFPSKNDMLCNNGFDTESHTLTPCCQMAHQPYCQIKKVQGKYIPLLQAPSITTMSREMTPVYMNLCILFSLPHSSCPVRIASRDNNLNWVRSDYFIRNKRHRINLCCLLQKCLLVCFSCTWKMFCFLRCLYAHTTNNICDSVVAHRL